MKRNKFSKALKQLKSTELDERIKSLEEAAPTNSIGGVYALNQPGQRLGPYDPPRVFYPDADGNWPDGIPGTPGEKKYIRPAGYWDSGPGSVAAVDWETVQEADFAHSGTSTDGFIDAQTGRVLSDLPPNSRNFILGPLVDGYVYNHGYDDYTNIGYIQKDTRQFVLLARIGGYWKSGISGIDSRFDTNREWDGSSITIYNSNFTLEMAEWFRDQYNANRYVKNVSYFYSGGYPQSSNPSAGAPPGSVGGASPGAGGGGGPGAPTSAPHGSGPGNPNIGTPQNAPNQQGPTAAGAPFPNANPNSNPNTTPPLPPNNPPPPEEPEGKDTPGEIQSLYQAMLYSYKREYEKANSQAAAITGGVLLAGWTIAQLKAALGAAIVTGGTIAIIKARMNAIYGDALNSLSISLDPYGVDQAGPTTTGDNPRAKDLTPEQQAEVEAAGNELRDAQRALNDLPADATDAQRDMAQERLDRARKNRQRIRKKHREENKNRRESSTLNGEVLTESRKKILREIKQPYKMKETPKQKYKMNFKGKFRPQNTPDVTACKQTDEGVKAKNAAGQTWRTSDKHWTRYESQERMNIIYDHVGHGNQYWEMIVNENQNKKGIRDRKIQEQLNIIAHEKAMLQEDPNYASPFRKKIEEQETMQYDNDPLFKKVAKKLKTEIDYPDKPSKAGYPDTPPPEMVNGFHPKYGKMYKHDKLDPQSAEAMPPTGNPEIDANILKARRIKKILGKGG